MSALQQNFLKYLVPQNPIYDLAHNIVPAIAIFGIISGLALMHLKQKEPLISMFESINTMLEKILKGITLASPLGVLAIIANISGNIYWSDIKDFGFYIIPLIIIVIIFTFWILPAILTSFTPLSYREVITEFRTTCLLAFLIGSPSIAIPFLNQCVKRYSEKFRIKDKELHSISQMIVPVSYTFTQIGNLLILFFMMYLSYYFDTNLSWINQTLVSALTIPMSFGGPEMMVDSISFLSKQLALPAISRELYDRAAILTQNFQVLLNSASMVTFVILLLLAYYKRLQFQLSKFFTHFFIYFFFLFFMAFGLKFYIYYHFPKKNPYSTMSVFDSNPEAKNYKPAKIYKIGEAFPENTFKKQWTENRISDTKTFYVGYQSNIPPFCYFNDKGELSGFSIALAYQLANDMDVNLVFIPCFFDHLPSYLYNSIIDTTTMPVLLPTAISKTMGFTHPWMKAPFALIVLRERKNEFVNYSKIKTKKDLKIGTIGYFIEPLESLFPQATSINLNSMDELDPQMTVGDVDGFFCEKEAAIGYCREHPGFITIDYPEISERAFLGFPVKAREQGFLNYLNRWMLVNKQIKFIDNQYNYWILRKPKTERPPRWSVFRNVFGFGKKYEDYDYKERP